MAKQTRNSEARAIVKDPNKADDASASIVITLQKHTLIDLFKLKKAYGEKSTSRMVFHLIEKEAGNIPAQNGK